MIGLASRNTIRFFSPPHYLSCLDSAGTPRASVQLREAQHPRRFGARPCLSRSALWFEPHGRVPAGRQPAEPDADARARGRGVVKRHHEMPAVRPRPFRAGAQADAAQPQHRTMRCGDGSRRTGGHRATGYRGTSRGSHRQRRGTDNPGNQPDDHTQIVGRSAPAGQALPRRREIRELPGPAVAPAPVAPDSAAAAPAAPRSRARRTWASHATGR